MDSELNQDAYLGDLLLLYYKKLFPALQFYLWLGRGSSDCFAKREISFTLKGDIYLRYQSFDTHQDFQNALAEKNPIKIDVGAIYPTKLKDRNIFTSLKPVGKEIVFDIDLTDYDDIRTCCSRAAVCNKCWKFMVIASRIIDSALKEDLGFHHILWVFSGRRGIHAWVCDKRAILLEGAVRSAIAEYLQVIKGGSFVSKKVFLPEIIHPSLERALNIIDRYFIEAIVTEQDILGTEDRLRHFLKIVDEDIRPIFQENMSKVTTSMNRWEVFENTLIELQQKDKLPEKCKHLRKEIKLYYAYPRLDMAVTKGLNHLLKAPFCVHPKTSKICVPFYVSSVDSFDPNNVPTIKMVLEEMEAYDLKIEEEMMEAQLVKMLKEIDAHDPKTEEQEDEKMETEVVENRRIKDYKKTSLFGPINIFKEFLRNFRKSSKRKRDQLEEVREELLGEGISSTSSA